MTIHTRLYSYLSTYSSLASLVSTRIYPSKAPDKTALPYIVYAQQSPGYDYHLTGISVKHPFVEFSCYGETFAKAREVADKVIEALEAWRGSDGVQHVVLVGDSDEDFELRPHLYMVMLVFEIWFT